MNLIKEQEYIDKFVAVFITHWTSDVPYYKDHDGNVTRILAKTIAKTIWDTRDEIADANEI